jgi:hypothetical protein
MQSAVRESYDPGGVGWSALFLENGAEFDDCAEVICRCLAGLMSSKFGPIVKMRLLKMLALLVNEGFGRLFLGWGRGESR